MNRVHIEREILDRLAQMNQDEKTKVLEFVRTIGSDIPQGTPASVLLEFAGSISAEDSALMKKAIEEGCEGVDLDEWKFAGMI